LQKLNQEKVGEMLKLISMFPRLVDQVDNMDFFREVSKEELCGVLDSFKKDKSHGTRWLIA
jgi:hypothetical protein